MPHDRVMIETDSPFLAPQVIRGKRNDPSWVAEVAKAIASLWEKDLAYVDHVTTVTTKKFFHVD